MTGPKSQSFDPFSDKYHETLTECLEAYGGRDAQYYNRLKANLLIRLASKRLGDLTQRNFLDLGCGTGLTDEIVSPRFRSGVGMDLSLGMLKARVCRLPNCSFVQGSVTSMPFPAASFDIVFSVTLIHHLSDGAARGMFSEIKRVLKSGGLMIHFDHNPRNFLTRRIVSKCIYDKDTTLRPMKRIGEIAGEAGFNIADRGYLIFIPGALSFLEPLERILAPIPLGGQYFICAGHP